MKAKVFNRSNLPGSEHAHFPKGHKPWNTGTKGLTSANSTSFKKGQKPVMMRNHNREKASASMKEHWRIKKLYSKNKLTNEKKNLEPFQYTVNQVDRMLDEHQP